MTTTCRRYTAQEEKTMWEDRHLVSGFNCCPESVYDDFLSTKLLHRKAPVGPDSSG